MFDRQILRPIFGVTIVNHVKIRRRLGSPASTRPFGTLSANSASRSLPDRAGPECYRLSSRITLSTEARHLDLLRRAARFRPQNCEIRYAFGQNWSKRNTRSSIIGHVPIFAVDWRDNLSTFLRSGANLIAPMFCIR